MQIKKIGLCLGICFVLSGCAGKEKQAEENTEQKIRLTMITERTDYETLEEMVEEKFPNVELEVECFPEEQYYTVLKTRLATGNGADFLFVQPGYAGSNGVKSLAEAGYLLPITELVQESSFEQQEEKLLQADGEIYGLSSDIFILGISYNKKIFSENNLQVPTCWEDFLDCCETLKKKQIQPIIVGNKTKMYYQFGLYQIAAIQLYPKNPSFDEQLLTGESSFLDQETWDHILEMYTGLFEKGYIQKDSFSLTLQEAVEKFQHEEAAMMISGSIIEGFEEQESEEYGMFPLPANNRGEQLYYSRGAIGGICIGSGTKEAELCREILEEVIWENDEDLKKDPNEQIQGSYYETIPYFHLCNQAWKNEVEIVMETKLYEYLSETDGKITDITKAMQLELDK
jgi:raffinose/stachyose/melibiose transport system substrate-binding protein